MQRPALFIGSSSEGKAVAQNVRAQLVDVAEITLWNEGPFGLGQGYLESLVAALDDYEFAILVLTPDDMTQSRDQSSQSPRDNVLFECGLFMGRLGRDRTFILYDADQSLKIPSDLAGVQHATYRGQRKDGNVLAAVGEACDAIREALRRYSIVESDESIIYDGRRSFDPYHYKAKENYRSWDRGKNPILPKGEGTLKFEDGTLHVQRNNTGGRLEVQLINNGPGKPVIPKHDARDRKIRIRCEAKAERPSKHSLRFVLKDELADKLIDERANVPSNETWDAWEKIDLRFLISAKADFSFRIDDEVVSDAPGSIRMRNLVITETKA